MLDVLKDAWRDIILAEIRDRNEAQISVCAHGEDKSSRSGFHHVGSGRAGHTRVNREQCNDKALRCHCNVETVNQGLKRAHFFWSFFRLDHGACIDKTMLQAIVVAAIYKKKAR